ncbi:hypothetical protein TNCV_1688301 [Trichonephila clavipes]|nr:hypothetical protein TNCV_1688301 [Trichonephila clavipes]
MVSDGTEFAVGDIERLFDEARRNTKPKHEKWAKYYDRRRRDVKIKNTHTHKVLDYLPLRRRYSNSGEKRKPTNTDTPTTQTPGETGTLALHLENSTKC